MHPRSDRRATPEGKKELIGFTDGARESAQDWRELLLDLKRRGLTGAPQLAIADGGLGFWKALGEIWPTTREQRCWVHVWMAPFAQGVFPNGLSM
jgi:putative transposase